MRNYFLLLLGLSGSLSASAQIQQVKFCDKKFQDSAMADWAHVSCGRVKNLSEAQGGLKEFFFRAKNSLWSAYEFPLSEAEIKKIFQMEARIEEMKGSPSPYIAQIVARDFEEAKIPRTSSALRFFIQASRYTDGAYTEVVAVQLASSLGRSPEQFVQVVSEVLALDASYASHTATMLEFGDSYMKSPIQKKSILAALKLEPKFSPSMKPFFDLLRKWKDR